jgi:hypothetical protein
MITAKIGEINIRKSRGRKVTSILNLFNLKKDINFRCSKLISGHDAQKEGRDYLLFCSHNPTCLCYISLGSHQQDNWL